jgi:hypothetical protein
MAANPNFMEVSLIMITFRDSTPNHINNGNGYSRVVDIDTDTRYLKTPFGWQVWCDYLHDFRNFFDKELETRLDAAFKEYEK